MVCPQQSPLRFTLPISGSDGAGIAFLQTKLPMLLAFFSRAEADTSAPTLSSQSPIPLSRASPAHPDPFCRAISSVDRSLGLASCRHTQTNQPSNETAEGHVLSRTIRPSSSQPAAANRSSCSSTAGLSTAAATLWHADLHGLSRASVCFPLPLADLSR